MTFDAVRARQRRLRQAAAGTSARRQRMQIIALALVSALTLGASTGAWALTSYVSSSLQRVDAGTSGTPSSGPVTILVAGIDSRSNLTRHQQLRLHVGYSVGENTDVLMVVHIPANHRHITVVSLPRDSWVTIPGHGMNKINAALALGGPALMVKTVEQTTGLTINDYVEVDFLGFVRVVNALGGVNICLPFAVDDHYSGLRMSAGRHHVDGVTALEFVRDRHSFALSDLQRIKDEQQLLSSMLAEATSAGVLSNPLELQRFLSAVTGSVTVDKGFNLIQLADELRGVRGSDVTFTTVPLASINYMTPTGQSAVLWDSTAAAALFKAVRDDTGVPARHKRARSRSHAKTVSPVGVHVDVYNGTEIVGLSARTGRDLAALGFSVHKAGLNWAHHNVGQTVIQYPPGSETDAKALRAVLPGAALQQVAGLARLRIVLGTADHTVTGAPQASSAPAPVIQGKTAAQAACR
jgi:LCP family protein required for cell wall assembly